MSKRIYNFKAIIQKVPDIDGAYIIFPHDIKKEFGRGRLKVRAEFDSEVYEGSIVNMGLKIPTARPVTSSALEKTSAPK